MSAPRPLDQVFAVALDHATDVGRYPLALRERIAAELPRMRIAGRWALQSDDHWARCWAHDGRQAGWVTGLVALGDLLAAGMRQASVSAFDARCAHPDGGSDLFLGTWSSLELAQGAVDEQLRSFDIVLVGVGP